MATDPADPGMQRLMQVEDAIRNITGSMTTIVAGAEEVNNKVGNIQSVLNTASQELQEFKRSTEASLTEKESKVEAKNTKDTTEAAVNMLSARADLGTTESTRMNARVDNILANLTTMERTLEEKMREMIGGGGWWIESD